MAAKRLYDASLGRFTIGNSDIIASVSKSDLDFVAKTMSVCPSRLRYLPNAVDTDTFKPRETKVRSRGTTLLFLGDLEPWKGVGLLIDWIHKWKESDGHDITVRFVGQGSYLPQLLQLRKELDLGGNGLRVEVLGARRHSEIPAIMNDSTVLVVPSLWEGMPTVVLEAMASGVPVISTPVGAVPEVIRNMETGFLIDWNVDSFRKALSVVLNDDQKTARIARSARSLVEERFSVGKVSKVIDDLYSEMCCPKRAGS